MRGKELLHVIIKKREARRPQALPVSGQVDFAPNDSRFELGGAISTISEALDYWIEVQEVVHRSIGKPRNYPDG